MVDLRDIQAVLDKDYGFRINAEIYTSHDTMIYKGVEKSSGLAVVIKILNSDYPSVSKLKKIEREYEITRKISSPGVIEVYKLIPFQKTKALIIEDFGGIALSDLDITGKIGIRNFLRLAINICTIVGDIHKKHIIHKDLKPRNILLNPETGVVKIIDFGLAAQLSREVPETINVDVIEGTFLYMSPEQTGKIKYPVDFRADLYSLGITFYELLTGDVPFNYQDKDKLSYAHAVKKPVPPRKLRPGIPAMISDIVLKLIEKAPNDRYQGATGVKLDFEKCLRHIERDGHIDSFVLGTNDFHSFFYLSEKLYNRKSEVIKALTLFDSLTPRKKEILFVVGDAGIGKSSLVKKLEKKITEKMGYFIHGKSDQLKHNRPYMAVIEAVTDLVDQMLTESDLKLHSWKERLLKDLGLNARVIIDIVPHLEIITGPVVPLSSLPPEQAKNRFNLAFQNFFHICSSFDKPLTLFIDDLQWVDPSTLNLLKLILTDTSITNLFFIGSFRNEAVGANTYLDRWLVELYESPLSIQKLAVEFLDNDSLKELIFDTFRCCEDDLQFLVEVVKKKTGGNPLFMKQFLKTLFSKGYIYFDEGWKFDREKIRFSGITSNMVAFLKGKVEELDFDSFETVKIASCYGKSFNYKDFSAMTGKSGEEVLAFLLPAIQAGILIRDKDKILFVHDQIQSAAYELVHSEMRIYMHYRIGVGMLESGKEDYELFSLASHMNAAVVLLSDDQKDYLLSLNIRAGQEAKASGAFYAAEEFFQAGWKLLKPGCWNNDYVRTFTLMTELVETEVHLTYYKEGELLFDEIFKHAKNIKDRSVITCLMISSLIGYNKNEEAIRVGLNLVNELGIYPDENVTPEYIHDAFANVHKQIVQITPEVILGWTVSKDDHLTAVSDVFASLMSVVFEFRPRLYSLLYIELIKIFIEKRILTQSAPYAFMSFCYMCIGYGKFDEAVALVDVIDRSLDKFADKMSASFYKFMRPACLYWLKTPTALIEDYRQALDDTILTGNNESGSYCYIYMFLCYFMSGQSLEELKQWSQDEYQGLLKLNQPLSLVVFNLMRQGLANLLGEEENPSVLKGVFFDEDRMLKDKAFSSNINFHFYYCFIKVLNGYLMDLPESCLPYIDTVEVNEFTFACQPFYMTAKLLFALVLADCCRRNLIPLQDVLLKLWKILNLFEYFKERQYELNSNKYYLIKAEASRLENKEIDEVKALYDKSVTAACRNEFIHEAAMANECAAKYFFALGKENTARDYLTEALYFYNRWGCDLKVSILEKQFNVSFGREQ